MRPSAVPVDEGSEAIDVVDTGGTDSDAPGDIDALSDAISVGDDERLRTRAHRVLSLLQNIGARRMSRLSQQLEVCLRTGRMLVGQLRDEFGRVHHAPLEERARFEG